MAIVLAAILFLGLGNSEARAQSDWWDTLSNTPERMIGLLELDDIVASGCDPALKRTTARAFDAPAESAPIIGTVYWYEEPGVCKLILERRDGSKQDVPTLESGYEIPAAIVYEQRGSWYRIRLAKGSAWIQRTGTNEFLPYPDLTIEKLPYVVYDWDGVLRDTPGASGTVIPLSDGWRELLNRAPSIEYLGSRRVDGELWINIQLATESRCGRKLDGVTPVSGWIPAYKPDRSPTVWFSPRGC